MRQHRLTQADSRPYSIALDHQGNVWATARAGWIAMLDRSTGRVTETRMDGEPCTCGPNSGPYSVSISPGGRVWVTEFQTDSIAVLIPATGAFKVVPLTARSGIRNAAINALGRYWFISASGRTGLGE